jgi:hypothetical protein
MENVTENFSQSLSVCLDGRVDMNREKKQASGTRGRLLLLPRQSSLRLACNIGTNARATSSSPAFVKHEIFLEENLLLLQNASWDLDSVLMTILRGMETSSTNPTQQGRKLPRCPLPNSIVAFSTADWSQLIQL